MAQENLCKFHITMFPWFAFGHMTPYFHLSNELVQRGHKISFLPSKKAYLQLHHTNIHTHLISFHTLTTPHVHGLTPGTETASNIPIVLTVPARKYPKDRQLTEAELLEPLPGYPSSTVMYRPHEAGSLSFMTLEFGASTTFYERITTAMKQCDALSIRTCQEIEGSFCEYIGSQYGKPMFLTGPVLPEPPKTAFEDWWAKWLGVFEPISFRLRDRKSFSNFHFI
ncbi:unnamed protein product [Ilex paraguariensis]|uniref:Uncharacterized protein n=1 Tax=Ilex paraguariensis TaxID=185542 RepID=A0ABC8UPI8_9AQUA